MTTTWIIDLSNYQPGFDIPRAIHDDGYSAVLLKATEGTTFRDPLFDTYATTTLDMGAIPGAYHYLRAGNGATQARLLYQRVADHGGPAGWIAACDNEADADWAATSDFFAEWAQLSGGHPLMMYSGNWWWGPRGWNGANLTPHLWDSRYVAGGGYGSQLYSKVPADWWTPRYGGWNTTTLLQFSDGATVAGTSPIDVSAYRGTADELRALLTAGGTPPAPPSYPTWPGRYLQLTSPFMVGADVRVWQRHMQVRGWTLAADGIYGPVSAGVCRQFQADKHLIIDGIVGPRTWDATWADPVT